MTRGIDGGAFVALSLDLNLDNPKSLEKFRRALRKAKDKQAAMRRAATYQPKKDPTK